MKGEKHGRIPPVEAFFRAIHSPSTSTLNFSKQNSKKKAGKREDGLSMHFTKWKKAGYLENYYPPK